MYIPGSITFTIKVTLWFPPDAARCGTITWDLYPHSRNPISTLLMAAAAEMLTI